MFDYTHINLVQKTEKVTAQNLVITSLEWWEFSSFHFSASAPVQVDPAELRFPKQDDYMGK